MIKHTIKALDYSMQRCNRGGEVRWSMGIEHLDIKNGSCPSLVPEFLCRNIESCIVLNLGGVKLKLFPTEGLEYRLNRNTRTDFSEEVC